MISCRGEKYGDPTSIVGSSLTWKDHEVESIIGNEHVPDGDHPPEQICRSLDSLLCRTLSAKLKSSQNLLFQ